MSIKAVAWALDQYVSDAYAKLVLIGLCDAHNGESGACFPSKASLAVKASCSVETVTRKLKWLVENGWISAVDRFDKSGRQTSNSYTILMDEIQDGEGVCVTPRGVYCDTGEGVTADTPINRNKEPETIKEKNTKKENPRSILETVLDAERADAVIEHRKSKRSPLTIHAAKLLVKKFSKLPNPNDGADFMIERGYQGFEVAWMQQTSPQNHSNRKKTYREIAEEWENNGQKTIGNSENARLVSPNGG